MLSIYWLIYETSTVSLVFLRIFRLDLYTFLGNQNEIKSFFDRSSNLGLKIKNCVLYGPDRKDNCSEKIISVNSIHEAIDYVNKLVFKPWILLFTASDSDAEFSIKSFKSHVLKSQIQK